VTWSDGRAGMHASAKSAQCEDLSAQNNPLETQHLELSTQHFYRSQ
jgi:hypothetical protein